MTLPRPSLALLALAALFIGGNQVGLEPKPAAQPASGVEVADGDVRLRKLHLVRPDLIPYPLAVEHFC